MLADRVHEFFGGSDVHESIEVARVEGDVMQDKAPAVHDGHHVGEGLDRRDDDSNHRLGGRKYGKGGRYATMVNTTAPSPVHINEAIEIPPSTGDRRDGPRPNIARAK